jgi:hypothetical protein
MVEVGVFRETPGMVPPRIESSLPVCHAIGDFSLFKLFNQKRPGDIQEIRGLLGCQFGMPRNH